MVLNSLVVPPFLRRGNLQRLRGCSTCLWCHPFCDAGIYNGCVGAQLACGASISATREFATVAWVLNLLVAPAFLRRGNLQRLRGCSTCLWCHPFCDAGICNGFVDAQFTLFGGLFYFAVSSCTLVKWNSRASNKPRSLNFSAGIGSNAKKLSVINGALNVAPTSRVIVS
jgi:hypothetical protein